MHKKAKKEDKMQEVIYSSDFFLLNKTFDFKTLKPVGEISLPRILVGPCRLR